MFFSDTLILIFEMLPEEFDTLSYVTWMACNIIVEGIKRNIFFHGAVRYATMSLSVFWDIAKLAS